MNSKTVEEVDQHDVLFSTPLQLFTSKPYNNTFVEFSESEIVPTPKDATANVVTFTRHGNGVGVLKTSNAQIFAKMSLVHKTSGAIVGSVGGGGKSILPIPLRTMWKTKELKINDTLVTTSGNMAHIASYVKFLTREKNPNYDACKDINFSHLDTSGHMDSIVGFANATGVVNAGGYARVLKDQVKSVIDTIDTSLFSDGGGEIIIPSAFKIELRLTRVLKSILLSGADHADLSLDNTELSLDDLKIKIPVFKPNEQLRTALNTAFVEKQMEGKYYTSNYRVISDNILAGRRNHQVVDAFNGSCPTRLFIAFIPIANWNGAYNRNIFNFVWPNYSNVCVSINNNSVMKITSAEEAYSNLRNVLNRKYKHMPFTFDAFKNGYAMLGFDLTNNKDSHLSVLPSRPSGNVNIDFNFSQDTVAGVLLYIGEFRNEIKIGLKTPARLLHDI